MQTYYCWKETDQTGQTNSNWENQDTNTYVHTAWPY